MNVIWPIGPFLLNCLVEPPICEPTLTIGLFWRSLCGWCLSNPTKLRSLSRQCRCGRKISACGHERPEWRQWWNVEVFGQNMRHPHTDFLIRSHGLKVSVNIHVTTINLHSQFPSNLTRFLIDEVIQSIIIELNKLTEIRIAHPWIWTRHKYLEPCLKVKWSKYLKFSFLSTYHFLSI